MVLRPMTMFLAPLMQSHSAAIKATSVCQMVYAIYKGSAGLYSLAQVVPTEAGRHAARSLTVVRLFPNANDSSN